MDNKNRLFFGMLILGFVAILVGANHKVNGNENAYIALGVGMFFKLIAIVSLVLYNSSKLKKMFK